MKKIILSLLLCFAAANAFAALSAEEVLKKSTDKDLLGNLSFQSYETEYEFVSAADKDTVTTIKETVDGTKRRMESKTQNPKIDGYVYSSLITNDEATYVSVKYISSDKEIVFSDYKVVNDTGSVTTYDKTAGNKFIYDSLNISFDSSSVANSKEYVINVSVKDPDKVRENVKNKMANKEEVTVEELALYIMSDFDSKFFIDKNTLLSSSSKIQFSEESIYKSVSKSDEYKDKSEEEKRKIAKEMANKGTFAEIVYSDYKNVEGTKLFYPSETIMKSPLFADNYPDGVYGVFKTNYFKVLKAGEIDPSVFVPTNIKKGKGKVPKEFTQQPDIYGEMTKQMKKELIKSLKESIKESAKEEGKKMLKQGVGNVLKGLGGF